MTSLPYFPSKKLFPLSPFQVDERRIELERFIQNGRHLLMIADFVFILFMLGITIVFVVLITMRPDC